MKIFYFHVLFSIAFFSLITTSSFAQNQNTGLGEFLSHPMQGDPAEYWRYHFVLSNGTEAWLNFALIQVPTLGKKATAELSFRNFKGKNAQVGRQFETSDWVESKENKSIILRSDYRMTGLPGKGHKVYFSTSKNDGFFLDLTFDNALHGLYSAPNGNSPMHVAVNIPQGWVSGKIAIGKDTLTVKGQGSLVHSWHNKKLTSFANQTLSLFALNSGFTGTIAQGDKGALHGFAVYINDYKTSVVYPAQLQRNGNLIKIIWTDSTVTPAEIDLSKVQQKYSVLSTVDSWIEKQAAKVAMGGDRILLRGYSKSELGIQKWVAAGF